MDFSIDYYGWNQTGPFPKVSGSINADGQQLNIRFDVCESNLRAVHSVHNEMVCEDSCVEFFFAPYSFDPRYINIEVNPIGTVFASIGEGRHDRTLLTDEQICELGVRTTVDRSKIASYWTAQFMVPYSLISELFGLESVQQVTKIRCNFYKCGDLLPKPHWGSWKPVDTEQPDFHRSEFFCEVVL